MSLLTERNSQLMRLVFSSVNLISPRRFPFWPILSDSAIHKARPDIHAAAHCHSIYGKAWSAFGKPIDITTQDSCIFYDNHGVYKNFGGIVLAHEEGENIAQALGPKWKTCILQNHGLLTRELCLPSYICSILMPKLSNSWKDCWRGNSAIRGPWKALSCTIIDWSCWSQRNQEDSYR